MRRTRLSLAGLCLLAACWTAAAPAAVEQAEATFHDLVRDILWGSRRTSTIEGALARDLGIPAGTKAKTDIAEPSGSLDGAARKTLVFVDTSTSPIRPLCVVLFVRKEDKTGKTLERLWLRLSADGELERVRRLRGPLDTKAKAEFLDVRSDQARQRYRAELDFWLKGVGARR